MICFIAYMGVFFKKEGSFFMKKKWAKLSRRYKKVKI